MRKKKKKEKINSGSFKNAIYEMNLQKTYIWWVKYQSKVFGYSEKKDFILKVLFLLKQVKHHSGFIYLTKQIFWATLNTN